MYSSFSDLILSARFQSRITSLKPEPVVSDFLFESFLFCCWIRYRHFVFPAGISWKSRATKNDNNYTMSHTRLEWINHQLYAGLNLVGWYYVTLTFCFWFTATELDQNQLSIIVCAFSFSFISWVWFLFEFFSYQMGMSPTGSERFQSGSQPSSSGRFHELPSLVQSGFGAVHRRLPLAVSTRFLPDFPKILFDFFVRHFQNYLVFDEMSYTIGDCFLKIGWDASSFGADFR